MSVPKLVSELSRSPPEGCRAAVEALTFLASSDEAQSEIVAAGAARPLVQLLSSGSPEVRGPAARCLSILASSAGRRSVMLAAGATKPLWEMATDVGEACADWGLAGLCGLSAAERARAELAALKPLPRLLGLLKNGGDRSQVLAMELLRALSGLESCRAEMLEQGALALLVRLLPLDGSEARARGAAASLVPLACKNATRLALVKEGALPLLLTLLQEGSPGQQIAACGALRALALEDLYDPDDENPDLTWPVPPGTFLELDFVPALVSLLSSGRTPEVRAAAVLATHVLTEKELCQVPLLEAGAVPPLLEMLLAQKGETAETRGTTADTLRLLALKHREEIEVSVPWNQNREELLRTLGLYCF